VLKDIFPMINYIRNDSFWNAQIDQIWVDRDGEIDLIPRAGHHIVHLGTTENFMEKLDNLEAFYTEILPVAGWNTYKRINLEYKGQIVCNKNQ
jgi:cell division protein FtsQ